MNRSPLFLFPVRVVSNQRGGVLPYRMKKEGYRRPCRSASHWLWLY